MAMPNELPLRTAVDAFVVAPTRERREQLVAAADIYRDVWIEAKAATRSTNERGEGHATSKDGTTTYVREQLVHRAVNGITVRLALQQRTDETSGQSWWVMSWRSNLSETGRNRRFYFSAGSYWTIPARDALELLQEMASRGALDERYFDARVDGDLAVESSDDLGVEERSQRYAAITAPDEDWGEDPYFVIVEDPHPCWQKVMIVNRDTGMATFRSITTSADYKPKKELRAHAGWWLDNSMMDANAQQTRHFFAQLKKYFGV
jgi:hypothetical protein